MDITPLTSDAWGRCVSAWGKLEDLKKRFTFVLIVEVIAFLGAKDGLPAVFHLGLSVLCVSFLAGALGLSPGMPTADSTRCPWCRVYCCLYCTFFKSKCHEKEKKRE